jgi:hypothetical protein
MNGQKFIHDAHNAECGPLGSGLQIAVVQNECRGLATKLHCNLFEITLSSSLYYSSPNECT